MTAIHPRIVAALKTQLAALPSGAERVGWKAAYGIPEIEELIGKAPAVGHLTTATQDVPAPATHADVEVVVQVGSEELGVALELVDETHLGDGPERVVETNVMHRAFALGPTGTQPGEARLIVNGEVRGAAPAGADHGEAVEAIGRLLAAAGERLQPGDRILTGSIVQVPVAPGDHVVAEIDGLGRAALAVASRPG